MGYNYYLSGIMPFMKFLKSLFSIKLKVSEVSSLKNLVISKEFKDSSCRCVQQELDISELQWMNVSAYQSTKKILKIKSKEIKGMILRSKDQVDLFENY